MAFFLPAPFTLCCASGLLGRRPPTATMPSEKCKKTLACTRTPLHPHWQLTALKRFKGGLDLAEPLSDVWAIERLNKMENPSKGPAR